MYDYLNSLSLVAYGQTNSSGTLSFSKGCYLVTPHSAGEWDLRFRVEIPEGGYLVTMGVAAPIGNATVGWQVLGPGNAIKSFRTYVGGVLGDIAAWFRVEAITPS